MRVGVISDTHGLLRPEALRALAGVDHILHAGDIGGAAVLSALSELAPVTAVRGNNDTAPWAQTYPETCRLVLGKQTIYLLHDLKMLTMDPAEQGIQIIVAGHSHQPSAHERDGVLYLNPGSAGPRRFRLPVTIAELMLDGSPPHARIIDLLPTPSPTPGRRMPQSKRGR